MDLLQDLKMLLLSFNFVMICIVHKMLVLFENHVNYLNQYHAKSLNFLTFCLWKKMDVSELMEVFPYVRLKRHHHQEGACFQDGPYQGC